MPKGNSVGKTFKYSHDTPFGEHHKGEPLIAEMREIDLNPDQEVVLYSFDQDSRAPIISWTDGNGIPRMTTVDPDFFDKNFQAV